MTVKSPDNSIAANADSGNPAGTIPALWQQLHQHFHGGFNGFSIRESLDEQRLQDHLFAAPHMRIDTSKNLLDATAAKLLNRLASACGVERERERMFAGEIINTTEKRAVLHTLLRCSPAAATDNALPEAVRRNAEMILQARASMLHCAETLRNDSDCTDVVNIGIGGSCLGPKMVTTALQHMRSSHIRLHFVSNIDGHQIHQTLQQLDPATTRFIVASKSFTTQETLTNAQTARAWLRQHGQQPERHMIAITSNVQAAQAFGAETILPFWDWVGGRYSLWSAIGLPIAISLGADAFTQLLHGAEEMDAHFRQTPLERNAPIQLALLDVWYRNLYNCHSRCTAPYHSNFSHLVPYLQQLEMESNGKHVRTDGDFVDRQTQPVIFGDVGSDSQHAFFQMLHQGTTLIPLEIIACARPAHPYDHQHRLLLANAIAQAKALMDGKPQAQGHRHFPGNRPSTFILMDALTPQALGALIALYEHRTFVSGAIWGINSFDQFGVELGKTIATDISGRLQSGKTDGLDPSTAALVQALYKQER